LIQDVVAVDIGFDHSGNPANLPFYPTQTVHQIYLGLLGMMGFPDDISLFQ
jgi:hypothetical protein